MMELDQSFLDLVKIVSSWVLTYILLSLHFNVWVLLLYIYIYIYLHICTYKHMCMLNFRKNIGKCLCSHHKHTKRYTDEMKLFGPSIWVFILDYNWAIYLGGFNKIQLGQYMNLTLGFLRVDNYISFGPTN